MTDNVQMAATLGSRYLLHETLGHGGMGDVYRATLRADGSAGEFAAKVLRPEFSTDPQVIARFLQESRILTTLQNDHLVRVHDLVLDNDKLAIVMDYVKGSDLRKYLRTRPVLPAGEAVDIVAQILEGLAAAHQAGVVHRDVKPENVLLDASGPTRVVKVADFGISRMAHGPTLTRMTSLIGSPEYMAPELAEHEHASPAADVYAAGIVLYELLAGRTPFAGGQPVAVLRRHLDEDPPSIPGVDPALWAIVERMLAKHPQARPTPAEAVAGDLRLLRPRLDGQPALPPIASRQAPDPTRPSMARERSTTRAHPPVDPSEADTMMGRILAPIGAAPAGPAHQVDGSRLRGRRRGVALAGVAVAVLAAAVMAWVLRPSASVAKAPMELAALALAPSVIGDGVIEQRSWRLSTASSGNFTEEVTLSNPGSAPTDLSYDMVIPKEVAESVTAVTFSPTPESIIEDDPVVRYQVALDPGQSLALRYTTTVKWEGSAQDALATWSTALRAAVASYRQSIDAVEQVSLTRLTLEPQSFTLEVASARRLTLAGEMSDGTRARSSILGGSTWVSDDPGVASVDGSGRVTARSPGQATVTASVGGVSASSVVSVRTPDSAPARPTGESSASSPNSVVASPRAATPKPTSRTSRPTSATPKPSTVSPTPPPASSSPTPTPTKKLGDINGDGVVNDVDKEILLADWQTSAARSDLNRDGIVDVMDLSILLSNWG